MLGAPAKGPAAYASRLTGLADVTDVLVNLDRQAPGRLDAWCAGEGPGRLRVAAHGDGGCSGCTCEP